MLECLHVTYGMSVYVDQPSRLDTPRLSRLSITHQYNRKPLTMVIPATVTSVSIHSSAAMITLLAPNVRYLSIGPDSAVQRMQTLPTLFPNLETLEIGRSHVERARWLAARHPAWKPWVVQASEVRIKMECTIDDYHS
jgi:hypothetical protein